MAFDDSTTPTRRRFLATATSLALGAAAGCTGSDDSSTPTDTATDTATATATPTATQTATETPTDQPSAVETLVSIPGDPVPENMALGPDGALYFGITAGQLRHVAPDQLGQTDLTLDDTEQLATLPGAIGVETAPDGTAYVAVATQDDDAGVWSVSPDGGTEQVISISGFPNDILYDADRDRMLVTESRNGLVYSVTPDGTRSTWLDDDRLATESFGANGVTRASDGTVYVAVTRAPNQTGRLLAVTMNDDGSAGDASLFLEDGAIFGADGITARDDDIYVAANSQNRVVRVASDGSTSVTADEADGLVFPSDVVFGTGEMSDTLFICNFANQSPEQGAILHTTV